ncbi:hypothetical protein QQG55_48105 [Brugia pahangi]|uniref:Transposase n=1 Tax=Brugia pahangi TaxID=6280 RepID=A0A0N4TIR0_BRUPA|nr:unnamed protein product [Brugia pahangi]
MNLKAFSGALWNATSMLNKALKSKSIPVREKGRHPYRLTSGISGRVSDANVQLRHYFDAVWTFDKLKNSRT